MADASAASILRKHQVGAGRAVQDRGEARRATKRKASAAAAGPRASDSAVACATKECCEHKACADGCSTSSSCCEQDCAPRFMRKKNGGRRCCREDACADRCCGSSCPEAEMVAAMEQFCRELEEAQCNGSSCSCPIVTAKTARRLGVRGMYGGDGARYRNVLQGGVPAWERMCCD